MSDVRPTPAGFDPENPAVPESPVSDEVDPEAVVNELDTDPEVIVHELDIEEGVELDDEEIEIEEDRF